MGVGSLEVGPLSVCASDSWILSVEVAEVDESWTTHNEDWVMVDSGAGVSACPVDYAPECEVNRGSAKLPLVSAGGDRIVHIGQKTVGYATRDGANVEIAFEAAKVRLLSVDSLVEKGQVAVFTDSGGFIIPRSALQVDPAVRKLSMKRQNGHFWLPLARRVETSVNPVMVAPMEDAAEGQDVDGKMDEELPVEERSARVVRKPGEPTPERSAHEATHFPFRDWGPHCVSCTASDPAHQLTERAEGRAANGADRLPVRLREGRHSGADGHHLHGNLLWKGRSRGYAVLEGCHRQLGSVPHGSACGLGSRIWSSGGEGRPRDKSHDVA